jgi:hypothetical protein
MTSVLLSLLQRYSQLPKGGLSVTVLYWRNKQNVVHVHSRILFTHKEDEILSLQWVDLEEIMVS